MSTSAAPQSQYSLSSPPPGARFEYDEVKTDRGATSLGQVPILTWGDDEQSIQQAIAYYGAEGISNILNGTSLRVSFQSIARRLKDPKKNKSDEEIALEQINFRPGKREGGQSTPASRAANATKKAASVANADVLAQLMGLVSEKKLDAAMLANLGFTQEQIDSFYTPVATPAVEEDEGEQNDAGTTPA
jgi:hypothetical protein